MRHVVDGTATVGTAAITAIKENLTAAQETLTGLAPHLKVAKWALLAVTLTGVGVMVWARIEDRRRGVR
ncbi:hypothetical protein ABAZ39_11885 [Azospirillum argentinense]|uniref:Uncharacterized protein n=1 Tax=Azospirillum argentinense TaxID=2970906 RepID=A0A060DES8_9PROT|nr:hypothetical protein [Azospirillum argentinense]AIB12676.1 hypothetical protein ABAZ39_11885 [Azospirillum argentinense]EZQ09865.1 hypothetical protein ABAZ39_13310 [Azospirillum argentinense]